MGDAVSDRPSVPKLKPIGSEAGPLPELSAGAKDRSAPEKNAPLPEPELKRDISPAKIEKLVGEVEKKKSSRRKSALNAHLAELLSQPAYSDDGEPVFIGEGDDRRHATYEEVVALRLVQRAASGDKDSIREVFDRQVGKPVQSIDMRTVNVDVAAQVDDVARARLNQLAKAAVGGNGE